MFLYNSPEWDLLYTGSVIGTTGLIGRDNHFCSHKKACSGTTRQVLIGLRDPRLPKTAIRSTMSIRSLELILEQGPFTSPSFSVKHL